MDKKDRSIMENRYGVREKPGNTYLSRKCNIIGSTRFTTVFGMGTGMDQCLTRLKVVNWETCIVAYVE
ncbi:MAG: hypothetical protein ACI87A_003726 [Planctomycetota bacterium]|jgi:hypothetical protein